MTHSDECGREVLETLPLVMRAIRAEMRRHRLTDLSVPQFRALAFLLNYPNASLSDVAEHVGSTLPSMSKLMDGLVTRGYTARRESSEDRRRKVLTLTPEGESVLAVARKGAQDRLSGMLAGVGEEDSATITRAMAILRRVFQSAPPAGQRNGVGRGRAPVSAGREPNRVGKRPPKGQAAPQGV